MTDDHLCRTCRQRLDSVLWSVGRHPGCSPAGPLNAEAFDRLLRNLAGVLGTIDITETTTTKEIR